MPRPPKLTLHKHERAWVAQLRWLMPNAAPAGWSSKGVQRVTPHDQPTVLGVVYEGKGMHLVVTRGTEGTTITLSGTDAPPSPEMIATAKEDLFPEKEIKHTAPLSGLVFFQLPE